MSNVSQFPSKKEQIADQAGQWVAALERGLSASEQSELDAWLAANKHNRKELLELAMLWDQMGSLGRLAELFPEQQIASRRPRRWARLSAAASVLIGVSLTVLLSLSSLTAPDDSGRTTALASASIHETAVGEQVEHELPDGSNILLNTNSLVRVEYTSSNRLLILERGEMHVRVAHDNSRPLSVMIGNRVVQAVGTEFNVEITRDHSIELVVTDGVVKVGIIDKIVDDIPRNTPILLTDNSKIVRAGEEVVLDAGESRFDAVETQRIEEDEISVKLSWREGNLVFRGESLEEAVTEVGRYTAVEFVIVDEEAKKIRVAGLFKAGDVDGLLAALRDHFNISYEWQGDDKILLNASN